MLEIGRFNRLTVAKFEKFGVFLDAGSYGNILLPKRYVPEDIELGDELRVFVYHDSESRLIATTETPKAQVGDCALLKVADVNNTGAFLDWGLPKDLMVPFGQQRRPMEKGNSYVVYIYQDPHSELITASSKLDRFLSEEGQDFTPNQQVELLIAARTDLGYRAVINNSHLGMLFSSEILQPVRIGQRMQGYIKSIREDGKINLSLQLQGQEARDQIGDLILDFLKYNQGRSSVTDKSSPELIFDLFQTSKGNFKKALGGLLKRELVSYDDKDIVLTEKGKQQVNSK